MTATSGPRLFLLNFYCPSLEFYRRVVSLLISLPFRIFIVSYVRFWLLSLVSRLVSLWSTFRDSESFIDVSLRLSRRFMNWALTEGDSRFDCYWFPLNPIIFFTIDDLLLFSSSIECAWVFYSSACKVIPWGSTGGFNWRFVPIFGFFRIFNSSYWCIWGLL